MLFNANFIVCFTVMTANGLLSAVVPDIEKRFQLSGKDLGILAMCNEFAQLFLIGFVSYYGSYGNKAKWLACGCFVTGKLVISMDSGGKRSGMLVVSFKYQILQIMQFVIERKKIINGHLTSFSKEISPKSQHT